MLICVTEKRTKQQIGMLAEALESVLKKMKLIFEKSVPDRRGVTDNAKRCPHNDKYKEGISA